MPRGTHALADGRGTHVPAPIALDNTKASQLTSKVEQLAVGSLHSNPRNARTHSAVQVHQIAASIERFGFTNPILIDDEATILAGHGRLEAAKQLGMDLVPVLRLSHLSQAERRAYVLADNKLALNAGWDRDVLAIELQGLIDLDFEVQLTGFSAAEIDFALDAAADAKPNGNEALDHVPALAGPGITHPGDLWQLGRHRLLCGNARSEDDLDRLMDDASARMIFTDPPYNVRIDGHVQTRAKTGAAQATSKARHREFAEASGEMSQEAFTQFLEETLGNTSTHLADGGIAFVCMDWRHMGELFSAGNAVFDELKNLVVWNKTNAGMGTFYRSKHELVFVFKKGSAKHINTFGLGDTGRYRTNVWDYAGMTSVGRDRQEALALHPTVKPVAMIVDALKDCSHRGHHVLDPFGGSGSTLIAAETCGRAAHLLELDPLYCDTTIVRWQQLTGQSAVLLSGRQEDRSKGDQETSGNVERSGLTFEALAEQDLTPEEAVQ